jgi:hypothetical protein
MMHEPIKFGSPTRIYYTAVPPADSVSSFVKHSLPILLDCLAGKYMNMHDSLNYEIGRRMYAAGLPPRSATPYKPPFLTYEEERAMQEKMDLFRSND